MRSLFFRIKILRFAWGSDDTIKRIWNVAIIVIAGAILWYVYNNKSAIDAW